ncbi:MAG: AAA family ATPase [Nitrososphaerota archaeon]|nr:AAA family ATPase [Nitrososphaerota archaeon]
MPRGIVGITGTPGTGKKSVAPLVAEGLGLPCIGLNAFAEDRRLLGRGGEVDTATLKKAIEASVDGSAVLYGHLLPYAVGRSRLSIAVVLRCEPSVLKGRLTSRRYPRAKVLENVEAELIGAVYSEAVGAFGPAKVVEVDTTETDPSEAAAAAIAAVARRRSAGATIDWLPTYGTGAKLMSLLSTG